MIFIGDRPIQAPRKSPQFTRHVEEGVILRSQSGSMQASASFIRGFQCGALMMTEVHAAKNELLGG
ncbi:hypothetical protein D3C78_1934330 [compost metagenome]